MYSRECTGLLSLRLTEYWGELHLRYGRRHDFTTHRQHVPALRVPRPRGDPLADAEFKGYSKLCPADLWFKDRAFPDLRAAGSGPGQIAAHAGNSALTQSFPAGKLGSSLAGHNAIEIFFNILKAIFL